MDSTPRIPGDTFARGMLLSVGAHGALVGALYWLLVIHRPDPITVELDLSLAPRLTPAISTPRRRKPAKTWTVPKTGLAPAPAAVAEPVEKDIPDPCPPPCPDRPGDFLPAALTRHPPKWVAGFIKSRDYPAVARRRDQEGLVLLRVFIDATGRVRDVQLLQGSYPALNQVALAKVRAAQFTPAVDESGRPVPCKVVLPIRFELK